LRGLVYDDLLIELEDLFLNVLVDTQVHDRDQVDGGFLGICALVRDELGQDLQQARFKVNNANFL